MRQYFAYIRVSTVKQGERGSSLQEQRSAIEAYAQRNGLAIANWFEERETAAKQGRREFTRMLADLKSGRAHGVIIHKIDRSARNLRDWANLGDLIDQGIDVQFAHDSVDLRSRGGRLSADIQAVVAADYIRNLREEVKKGFYGRLKQGLYPLPAPLGYLDRGKGEKKVIDETRAALVRQAFQLYASQRFSLRALLTEITLMGLRRRNGGKLTLTGISTILNNPFYIGIIRLKRSGETFQGAHMPLITKALFDRVQAILRGKTNPKTQKHEFLFSRIIRCQSCGYHLIGERQKRKYVYYRCHSKTCEGVSVREDALEALVRRCLAPLRFDDVDLGDFGDLVKDLNKNAIAEIERYQASLGLRLTKCDERIARLTDALLDAVIDKEVYEARKTAVLGERRSILDQLDSPDAHRSPGDKAFHYLELANAAYQGYETGIMVEKREILNSITSNLSVEGKSLAITLKSPFQEIVDSRNPQYGAPFRDEARTRLLRNRRLLEMLMGYVEREEAEAKARKKKKMAA